uniref:S41 family peptidase n=1 Tax=Alistipes putredinis TaxID=28117 RepID=UPI003FEFB8B8
DVYKRQVYDGAVDVTVNSVTWTDNGTTPVLTPKGNVQLGSATFTSPAIYMDKVVEIEESDKKAGYLLYMGFDVDYDEELIAAFDRFRAQNVTDLILDLRYNNGGDVLSSTVLGTLIAGEAYKGQLYAHMTFNEDRTEAGESGDYKIGVKETFESVYEPIERALQHALGLKKIYVLVSETTASASEMVINGLRGLDIEVNLIGMPTNGKNVGMEGVVRSFHNYDFLLFPVSFYIENAKGFRDYSDGFTPDVQIDDSAIYPGEFGTMMDQLGYLALQWIKTDNKPQLPSAMHTRGSCRSMRSFGDLWENRPVQPVGGAVMQPVREE